MSVPCPGSDGCKCRMCYGLYEWASENLSSTWGLQPTERPSIRIVADPEPMAPVRGALADRHPWTPRPSRHERYRAA